MENWDISFDEELKKIEGLTWLPFIGMQYKNAPTRVLIVAESFQKKNENWKKQSYCRNAVWEGLANQEWPNKTHESINSILTGESNSSKEETKRLWGNLSFCNLIQRAMEHEENERPTHEDFGFGLKILPAIEKVLKPAFIILMSGAAGKWFIAKDSPQSDFDGKIGGHKVIKPQAFSETAKICFTVHPSRFYSYGGWQSWHEYIKKLIPTKLY